MQNPTQVAVHIEHLFNTNFTTIAFAQLKAKCAYKWVPLTSRINYDA